jgi:glycogen operon protein
VLNAHIDIVPFTLPAAAGGRRWVKLLDTHKPNDTALGSTEFGERYDVPGRALLLFVLQPSSTPQRDTAAERSFQRVVQAMQKAALMSVNFGFE